MTLRLKAPVMTLSGFFINSQAG